MRKVALILSIPVFLTLWTLYILFGAREKDGVSQEILVNFPDVNGRDFNQGSDAISTLSSSISKKVIDAFNRDKPVNNDPSNYKRISTEPPSKEDLNARNYLATDQEAESFQNYFENTENEFKVKMRETFNESGLPPETFTRYQQLRSEYQEGLVTAFEEFYEQIENAKEVDMSFNEIQQEIANKVRSEFIGTLRGVLGESAYARYEEAKNRFNEEVKSKRGDRPYITIDF